MKKKQKVRVALAGVGGYGRGYLSRLLDPPDEENFEIAGLIDPVVKPNESIESARARGVPFFKDLDSFFAAGSADLVILATPIHLHAPQTIQALQQGAHVLCEKPLAATIQEARAMRAAEQASGKWVAIGYQASFSRAVQRLKQDIMQGVYGRPLRMKTLVLAPRSHRYYGRGRWAGAQQMDDGTWVLDSPVNNANAHWLHNMLYLLGASVDQSGRPAGVQGELYRANAITNYDTAALRCRTDNEVDILFLTSHAVAARIGPIGYYGFEKGEVTFGMGARAGFLGRLRDGGTRDYGSALEDGHAKLWKAIDAVRTGERPLCGIEAAMAHTLCMNGLQDSVEEIAVFPDDLVATAGEGEETITCAGPVAGTFVACYDQWMLPSEYGGLSWVRPGREINLKDYHFFPGGAEHPA